MLYFLVGLLTVTRALIDESVIAGTRFHFYPTALKGFQGIVFTNGVRMGRPATGKVYPASISKTVQCRKLILRRDIGCGV